MKVLLKESEILWGEASYNTPWQSGQILNLALIANVKTAKKSLKQIQFLKLLEVGKYQINAKILWTQICSDPLYGILNWSIIQIEQLPLLLSWNNGESYSVGDWVELEAHLQLADEHLSNNDFFVFPFDLPEIFQQYNLISSFDGVLELEHTFQEAYRPYSNLGGYHRDDLYQPGLLNFNESATSVPGAHIVPLINLKKHQWTKPPCTGEFLSDHHLYAVLEQPFFPDELTDLFIEHLYWNLHFIQAQIIDVLQVEDNFEYWVQTGYEQIKIKHKDMEWFDAGELERSSNIKPLHKGTYIQSCAYLWLDPLQRNRDSHHIKTIYRVQDAQGIQRVRNRPEARTYILEPNPNQTSLNYFLKLEAI